MPAFFKPVVVEFKGVEYEIPANKRLKLIQHLEEILPLSRIFEIQQNPGNAPFGLITEAYIEVLRFAGVPSTEIDEGEVYSQLFEDDRILASITALSMSMFPPSWMLDEDAQEETPSKKKPANRKRKTT